MIMALIMALILALILVITMALRGGMWIFNLSVKMALTQILSPLCSGCLVSIPFWTISACLGKKGSLLGVGMTFLGPVSLLEHWLLQTGCEQLASSL